MRQCPDTPSSLRELAGFEELDGSCGNRFWVIGSVSRQFPGAGSSLRSVAGLEDVLDESCGSDEEDELVPEFDDNPGTTRGGKLSVLHNFFSVVWSTVAFDRWPTHRYFRVLRKALQVIELQACLRVIALLRRDQGRKQKPVLPRLFALPLLSSNLFCSACALMLWNRPRILVPLLILKWPPALRWLQKESKTQLYLYF